MTLRSGIIIAFFVLAGLVRPAPAFATWSEAWLKFCELTLRNEPKLRQVPEANPAPATLEKKPDFLESDELRPDTESWHFWTSRKPGSSANTIYLENARLALDQFDRWYRAHPTCTTAEFTAMLDHMHLTSAIGDPAHPQVFNTREAGSGASFYVSGSISPGVNRIRLAEMTDEELVEAMRSRLSPSFAHHDVKDEQIAGHVRSLPRKDPVSFRSALDLPQVQRDQKEVPLKIYGHRYRIEGAGYPFEWNVEIEGLDVPAKDRDVCLPRNMHFGVTTHTAPPARCLGFYVELGRKHLNRVRAIPPGTHPDRFMAALADYYHVMINSHLYRRLNNSLLMNQVNYLLRLHGYHSVAHGNLDYVAVILDSAQFRRVFQDHVKQFQNRH